MSSNRKCCAIFKQHVYHFQADEVDAELREELQGYLNSCEMCARILEVENSFLSVIKSKAERATAPPGLETRLSSLLDQEVEELAPQETSQAAQGGFWSRFLTPQVAMVAAAAVVALAAVTLFPGFGDAGPVSEPVVRTATVVDLQCDKAGKSVDHQRACTHRRHFNALKLEGGGYWYVNPDSQAARQVVFDPRMRGSRLRVRGNYYPDLETIRLEGEPELQQAAYLPGSPILPAALVVHSDL